MFDHADDLIFTVAKQLILFYYTVLVRLTLHPKTCGVLTDTLNSDVGEVKLWQ